MPNIYIVNSDGSSYNYPLIKTETTIGRGKSNDVVLADSTVSRNHAKITRSKKNYFITDLGSYNGTKLNDMPVQNTILEDKDQIKIGHNKLTFSKEDENSPTVRDSIILIPEEEEKDDQKIVKSSVQAEGHDSKNLLLKQHKPSTIKSETNDSFIKQGITDLERSPG